MPNFIYKAIDSQGRQVNETFAAASRSIVLETLMQRNLYPVSVEQQSQAKPAEKLSRIGRVTKANVEAFTRELANLLAAGVPLSRSLSILSREASSQAARKQWRSIHDSVAEGMSLADALGKWPKSFPPIYVAMVRAGETGGFIDLVLGQIANFSSREQDLKAKVKAAVIYPIILAVLAVAILIFLMTYFIPRFSSIFAEFGGSLPSLTLAIVRASEALIKYWLIFVIVICLIVVATKRALEKQQGRLAMERWLLQIPVVGKGVARFALVRFCRMLGTLAGAGVPLITALQVAKEAIGNQVLTEAVSGAIEKVRTGQSLAKSLATCPVLFPATVIEMVSVAEESGRLDDELVRLASAYEDQLDRHLKMTVAMAEPALLFIMAALVGTVVIGMLLPIFNLQELIR